MEALGFRLKFEDPIQPLFDKHHKKPVKQLYQKLSILALW
jgi:hypothetical protein